MYKYFLIISVKYLTKNKTQILKKKEDKPNDGNLKTDEIIVNN